ncbi:MAG: hypothetical protein FD180_4815 [Planctomycetota bacterium]|nr:MAG: hypothetical protein FD180_4815 [Planctomycetota bacterium]
MKKLMPFLAIFAAVLIAAAGDPAGTRPLTDLGKGKYKGEEGGLYGAGKNEPPEAHLKLAMAEAAQIRPLDAEGKAADDGKIVFLSLGMSNTSMDFTAFTKAAGNDKELSPRVLLVNGAQGGMDAAKWADPKATSRNSDRGVWEEALERIKVAGASPAQVQAAWMKQAHAGPAKNGEFPKHARALSDDLETIAKEARKRFPNLRLLYLSSRTYAGYAKTQLNPEPYSYEGAFAVRWLIEKQAGGDAGLNADAKKGEVKAPVLLWGPYLWADGANKRADGFAWAPEDFTEKDGTHPSESGQKKVADLLLKFLKTDGTAKGWFVKSPATK